MEAFLLRQIEVATSCVKDWQDTLRRSKGVWISSSQQHVSFYLGQIEAYTRALETMKGEN
jgi:hypothetical protein